MRSSFFINLMDALFLSSRHLAFITEKTLSVNAEVAGTESRYETIFVMFLNSSAVLTNKWLHFWPVLISVHEWHDTDSLEYLSLTVTVGTLTVSFRNLVWCDLFVAALHWAVSAQWAPSVWQKKFLNVCFDAKNSIFVYFFCKKVISII